MKICVWKWINYYKINEIGYDGLLEKEKKFLYEASQKLAKGEERN